MSPAVYEPIWLPATSRGHYRHMAKRDAQVWERFLALHAERFDAFAYDIAMGGVRVEGLPMDALDVQGYQYSTALKIDAVGRSGDVYTIIEVRPEATVSALGAAFTYTLVADREQLFPGSLQPAIVCNSMQPDVKWACDQLGILVFAIPTA